MYCNSVREKQRRSGLIYRLMNFLLGRPPIYNRYVDQLTPSTPCETPNLPPGPHSQLAGNYYYEHDGRREAKPPVELKPPEVRHVKFIRKETACVPRAPIPGNLYPWDSYKTSLANREPTICTQGQKEALARGYKKCGR